MAVNLPAGFRFPGHRVERRQTHQHVNEMKPVVLPVLWGIDIGGLVQNRLAQIVIPVKHIHLLRLFRITDQILLHRVGPDHIRGFGVKFIAADL